MMMKTKINKSLALAAMVSVLGVTMAQSARADHPEDSQGARFEVDPWTFVGSATDCAPAPAGTRIVASDWEKGIGLPDDKSKSAKGLLLSKNGLTTDCSSAGASIDGVGPKKKGSVPGITLTELGYDVRNGGHCGGGAPRFNVVATDGFHFMGACNNAVVTADTPQVGWKRVRIDPTNPAHAFPPLAAGATIISIDIVFDEGVDTGPDFSGFVIIDNIDINGTLIGQ